MLEIPISETDTKHNVADRLLSWAQHVLEMDDETFEIFKETKPNSEISPQLTIRDET